MKQLLLIQQELGSPHLGHHVLHAISRRAIICFTNLQYVCQTIKLYALQHQHLSDSSAMSGIHRIPCLHNRMPPEGVNANIQAIIYNEDHVLCSSKPRLTRMTYANSLASGVLFRCIPFYQRIRILAFLLGIAAPPAVQSLDGLL